MIITIALSTLLICITAGALAACSAFEALPSINVESDTVKLPSHSADSEVPSNSSSGDEYYEEDGESYETYDTDYLTQPGEESEEITESPEETTEAEVTAPSLDFLSLGNGTCAVIGIGSITDTYVVIPQRSPDGDVVTEISEKAFYSNDTVRAIEIPSTVSSIGEMAFSDCSSLIYIAVDQNNKWFTDIGGVLYSADVTKLLSYPSASGAAAIAIPQSVRCIAPMAFYKSDNLKTINFEGSYESWSSIEIGEMNYGLFTASIICTD